MLIIENINKLLHKTLGKQNFYVSRIQEDSIVYNPYTFARECRYIFELSNRNYSITVILNREEIGRDGNYDYKLTSSNGNVLYINSLDIRNIDKFLDKLRFVALG